MIVDDFSSFPDEAARRERVLTQLAALYDLTITLRRECPWDRKQTQEDIVAYTLEETYELVDAVQTEAAVLSSPPSAEGAPVSAPSDAALARHGAVKGELGDLLFQVYFLAQVAAQEGWYDLGEVAAGIHTKLVRRHPHIFGDATADTPDDVRRNWDEIKRTTEGREGIFHEVPLSFPATLYAQKVQQRAASVGFDWHDAAEVLVKVEEEAGELRAEMCAAPVSQAGRPGTPATAPDRVAEEVGDLLFSVVNLARKLKADPELSLRAAAQRFQQRVESAAELAAADGLVFEEIDLAAQDAYFRRAKASLRDGAMPTGRDGRV
jgi:MazG family protein